MYIFNKVVLFESAYVYLAVRMTFYHTFMCPPVHVVAAVLLKLSVLQDGEFNWDQKTQGITYSALFIIILILILIIIIWQGSFEVTPTILIDFPCLGFCSNRNIQKQRIFFLLPKHRPSAIQKNNLLT